jgi:hypothetical protein
MHYIDQFELDVLDHTGDLDLAEKFGEAARWAVITAAEAFAAIIGVPVEVLDLEVLARGMLGPQA